MSEASKPTATIYNGKEYQGASKSLAAGKYKLTELGIGNDKLSSLKVPDTLKVVLFEHDSFEGRRVICVRDTASLESANDQVSSIHIEERGAAQVIIYRDENYKGWSRALSVGKFDTGEFSLADNAVSSIIVPSGFRVKLYQNSGFAGKVLELTADTAALSAQKFNDSVSSIVVEKI